MQNIIDEKKKHSSLCATIRQCGNKIKYTVTRSVLFFPHKITQVYRSHSITHTNDESF